MANALFPPADDHTNTYSRTAHSILDEMIRGGNKVAAARKGELRCIEGLFEEFAQRVQQGGLRVLTLSGSGPGAGHVDGGSGSGATDTDIPNGNGTGNGEPPAQVPAAQQLSVNGTRSPSVDPSASVNVDSLDDVTGISSYEFLSIVDQIGNPEMLYNVLEVGPELWEDPFGS